MPETLDLEILLSRGELGAYLAEFRISDPQGVVSVPVRGPLSLDLEGLRKVQLDPAAYGGLLTVALFGDPTLRGAFDTAVAAAFPERSLRLRLLIDRSASELHSLRWETLLDPRDNTWLLAKESLLFSRLLARPSMERIQLRPQTDLSVVALIANPRDLGEYELDEQPLAPVDVTGELSRLRAALGDLPLTPVATDPNLPGIATLDHLVEALRQGADILYIVCHGALLARRDPPGPYLWLEGPDGTAELVPGAALVMRLAALPADLRPRLVVLASCQSAGTGRSVDTQGALAAIGPQLATAGIPAVLAMQGSISMDTVAGFMPVFFRRLRQDGLVDQAAAAARGVVAARPDAAMPALFMCLRSGAIGYTPGFTGDRPGFDRWPALVSSLTRKLCTPVLGPALSYCLAGDRRQVAHAWAETYGFPLDESSRDDLPQVAQYLANSQDSPAFPRDLFVETLAASLPACLQAIDPAAPPLTGSLEEQIAALWRLHRARNPDEPYGALAQLPISVYINTNPDNLLETALADAGRPPVVEFCRWNPEIQGLPSAIDEGYYPSPEKPLVYHLFGHIREPASLVLSEDDYFDYLMWVNKPPQMPPPPWQLPTVVMKAWSSSSLMFLGFELYDWNFRLLLRSILNAERRAYPRSYPSVAVQINPGEGYQDPERARRYLEQFFIGMKMGIFWGTAQDFTRELRRRSKK